jgi:hypothetical protein
MQSSPTKKSKTSNFAFEADAVRQRTVSCWVGEVKVTEGLNFNPSVTFNPTHTMVIKGVTIVVANNNGVSVWTKEGIIEKGLTGYAWLIKNGSSLPFGLKLVNDTPGHYMLVPIKNMPLDTYKGLLEEMGMKCEKYLQVKKDGTMMRVG